MNTLPYKAMAATDSRHLRRTAGLFAALLISMITLPAWATCNASNGEAASDVAGVRVGMTFDQALAGVKCDAPELVITVHQGNDWKLDSTGIKVRSGFEANPAPPKDAANASDYAQQRMAEARYMIDHGKTPKAGHSRWRVHTVGLYGHERVIAVAHQQHFHSGHDPSNVKISNALAHKYGQPTRVDTGIFNGHRYVTEMVWAHTPQGQLIGLNQDMGSCETYDAPDDSLGLDSRCGLIISAHLTPLDNNPDLVDMLSVGSTDQAFAMHELNQFKHDLAQTHEKMRKAQTKANEAKADDSDI